MKITPLEIRQKSFERTLRGYDKDEVNGFLLTLSQEWERNQDELRELRVKLESAEREVAKLREVESSLFRTLKTAEDTGANVIEQANKSAELAMKESQLRAETLINEAKLKAKNMIEEADHSARQLLAEMEEQLKLLVDQYKTVQSQKDNILSDMKRLAEETLDRAERMEASDRAFDPDKHLSGAKRQSRKNVFPNETERKTEAERKPVPVLSESKVGVNADGLPKSFFDDIQ
jgi:cell division initiation protein